MHSSPVLDLLDRDEAIRLISVSPFSSSLRGYSRDRHSGRLSYHDTDTAIPKVRLFSLGGGPPPH